MESNNAVDTNASRNLSVPLLSPGQKNRGGAPPSFIWKFFTKLQQNNKKTNRYRAQCNFCQHIIEDGRVENLHKHILHVCQIATPDIKQYVQAELDKKEELDKLSGKSSKKAQKREQGQTPHVARAPATRPINAKEQEELDVKLLRLLIINSLPFGAVESPWMLDFCHSLKPSYVPAGAPKLQTTVLMQEYMRSRALLNGRLAQEQNVTVSIDLWRSDSNQPVYACNVAFSDGTVALLGAKELPSSADTADNVSGIIKEWITTLGPEKVGSLCTGDASSLRAARPLVASSEGFTHILQGWCPMHAFSLAVCSMLAFPWTNALVCGAHMIASWLHISSTASALLADEAKELGASVEVVPCNLSQVQSVHACLESLIHVEGAIKQMLQKHPNLVVDQQVREHVSSHSFWSQIKDLCKLLAPVTDAVKGIASKVFSLAEVTKCWLLLAKALQAAQSASSLPADFMKHCFIVFNEKAAELDNELCRLALFLNPGAKDVAVPAGNIDSLLGKARSVFQSRRHTEEECDRLSQQLQLYLAGSPPFDQPALSQMSGKAWWLQLGTNNPSVTELVNLAVFLFDIVPHAASVERVASIMGWYYTPVRSQLDVGTLARVVALKAHLQHNVPRVSKQLPAVEQQDSVGSLLLDVPPLGANASPEQLMGQLQLFHTRASDSHGQASVQSQTKLLMAGQYNLDHAALVFTREIQAVPAAPQALASPPAPRINPHEFVRTCFAEMGRKH